MGYDLAFFLLNEYQDLDEFYMPCNKWRVTIIIERIEKGVRETCGNKYTGPGVGSTTENE